MYRWGIAPIQESVLTQNLKAAASEAGPASYRNAYPSATKTIGKPHTDAATFLSCVVAVCLCACVRCVLCLNDKKWPRRNVYIRVR
jgi:hypothetical protein